MSACCWLSKEACNQPYSGYQTFIFGFNVQVVFSSRTLLSSKRTPTSLRPSAFRSFPYLLKLKMLHKMEHSNYLT